MKQEREQQVLPSTLGAGSLLLMTDLKYSDIFESLEEFISTVPVVGLYSGPRDSSGPLMCSRARTRDTHRIPAEICCPFLAYMDFSNRQKQEGVQELVWFCF